MGNGSDETKKGKEPEADFPDEIYLETKTTKLRLLASMPSEKDLESASEEEAWLVKSNDPEKGEYILYFPSEGFGDHEGKAIDSINHKAYVDALREKESQGLFNGKIYDKEDLKSMLDVLMSEGQAFEPDEHRDIGNLAFLRFIEGLDVNSSFYKALQPILTKMGNPGKKTLFDPFIGEDGAKITVDMRNFILRNGVHVTPGEIVALAGDFLGVAKDPIAFGKTPKEQEDRFEASFQTLETTDESEVSKYDKLLKHIENDAHANSPHTHWTVKFKKKARDLVDGGNLEYGLEMQEEPGLSGFWHSPYFELALKNFDHFGDEAKAAYLTGHKLAIKKAQEASQETDPAKKEELLQGAILRELFACHFLTDLFAAGHIRTPRKQILNYLTKEGGINDIPDIDNISHMTLVTAGFFARKMHDEDGDKGVYVTRKAKDKNGEAIEWEALGDGNYFGKANVDNARMACETVGMALEDLFNAFEGNPTLLDKHLDEYVPEPNTDPEVYQRPAMFYTEGDKVICRQAGKIPVSAKNALFLGSRLFNVRVRPAARNAVSGAKQTARDLKVLAKDEIEKLYNKMEAAGARCKLM